ncbi:MAG: hypothetical protein ACKVT2_07060 [Saprospiraceae bacterium]
MKNNPKIPIIYAYLQDPLVALEEPKFGFQEIEITEVKHLADGPTSPRFVVVDYNGTTGNLIPPVKWDDEKCQFKTGRQVLTDQTEHTSSFQFHQLNVWAIAQNTLKFFESGPVMGRKLPWGFEGNRLILVPHAGYGQNAYYDRRSKSLQFYYYNNPKDQKPVYTCLSADIIIHELAHAILDGIRPHFIESTQIQTAAFHEFFGDISAILNLLRNNEFRANLVDKLGADLEAADVLSNIADEFGRTVNHKPYLRSARNKKTMSSIEGSLEPHEVSEVLTGAMFDLIIKLSKQYIRREVRFKKKDKVEIDDKLAHKAARQAFWYTIHRMQRMALQPLDFLPPVDVTFRDYALAMLRSEQISNPTDPYGYRKIMFDVFEKRGILDPGEESVLLKNDYLFDRDNPEIKFNSSIFEIMKSRSNVYDFLNNNRDTLGIPFFRDFIVTDFYECNKQTRQGDRLPRQHVICYLWHEEIPLLGKEYGEYEGKILAMPCGGTLVFDDLQNLYHWANKPGTECESEHAILGAQRKKQFLQHFYQLLRTGTLGKAPDANAAGFIEQSMPLIGIRAEGGRIHLQTTPHLDLNSEHHPKTKKSWQISF